MSTSIIFGANRVVGSDILCAIVANTSWKKVVLVGRKFPPNITDLLSAVTDSPEGGETQEFIKMKLSDLSEVDKNEELLNMTADACFIAVGSSKPQLSNLKTWHSVEVDIIASIARLCKKIEVQYVALLSAIDAEDEPTPFSETELNANSNTNAALGWGGMLKHYNRMMGLKEMAVKTESKDMRYTRIFRPSSIITTETRYGCVDKTIFTIHKIFDPCFPTKYHSVKVELLGTTIVEDATQILSSNAEVGKAPLTYGDFLEIMAKKDEVEKVKRNGFYDE